jgi:hypothetical protein
MPKFVTFHGRLRPRLRFFLIKTLRRSAAKVFGIREMDSRLIMQITMFNHAKPRSVKVFNGSRERYQDHKWATPSVSPLQCRDTVLPNSFKGNSQATF